MSISAGPANDKGNRRDIPFFTEHVFLIDDTGMGNYRSLGSSVHVDRDVVLTKVGPLIIVGRLGLYMYPRGVDAVWEHSRIGRTGTIGLRPWTADKDIDAGLAHLLFQDELDLGARARRLALRTGMVDFRGRVEQQDSPLRRAATRSSSAS